MSVWLAPQGRWTEFDGAAPDPREVLRAGDLVAFSDVRPRSEVQPGARSETTEWDASSVELLVPCLEGFRLRSGFNFEISRRWNRFIGLVREFFLQRDFVETRTPTLVPSPGTEPFLEPFRTQWEMGAQRTEFFLPTSPEFHLKKMLAAGWTRLFEFKECFRNGESGAHHQPEFLMLEWYRSFATLDAIALDVEHLLRWLGEQLSDLPLKPPALRRVSIAELFAEYFGGFALTPTTSLGALRDLADRYSIRWSIDDTWDEIFFRLFLEKIEPHLGSDGPLLVRGYPPSQAALARIGHDGFADRFEVYWRGLELANAFHELNDPEENRRRFEKDIADKAGLGKKSVPVDHELIAALRFGLPPSGGIALGVERLFMAFYGIQDISEIRAFPFEATL